MQNSIFQASKNESFNKYVSEKLCYLSIDQMNLLNCVNKNLSAELIDLVENSSTDIELSETPINKEIPLEPIYNKVNDLSLSYIENGTDQVQIEKCGNTSYYQQITYGYNKKHVNTLKSRQYNKNRYLQDKERIKQKCRDYKMKNKPKIRKYKQDNKEKIKRYNRIRYIRNQEKIKEYCREYKKKNNQKR